MTSTGTFQQLLVVCTGNICRSPVGEALLRRALPHCRVASAGLGALVGEGMEPRARRLAEADGLDVGGHVARQLDASMVRAADLVLVMSESQRLAIAERYPFATGKVMRFGHWLAPGGVDVSDPYRGSDELFAAVHARLVVAADGWGRRLAPAAP
ncbi:low molecular weight protein-tyrosine-phosphatase [Halomonas nitroreducens]|uniref:protein-tyrosine-phosphatase n=1 Tax=Halomonas nitroreducens TaxID=447425 RepID=A0A3S0HQQ8_9GAMM|nr:low molecular weight protein-tyrosine-phosphatase [Halomonas nitroreducens]RTR05027.1 low molecular weight phosphotyrosine protein phosphatase [Halomonas nitroreducens]